MRHTAAKLDDITEEDFVAYESVRRSGICNMWSNEVEDITDITTETKLGIMKQYEALYAKWPHVRNLSREQG